MTHLRLGAALAAVAIACGPTPRSTTTAPPYDPSRALAGLPPRGDAPLNLSDDTDLATARAQYDLLAADAPDRAARRAELAEEYATRFDHAIEHRDRDAAYESFVALIGLWTPTEIESGAAATGLAPYADRVALMRTSFARSGGDREATLAAVVQMVIEPAAATASIGEIESIFAFADDLAVAQWGEGAELARPIEILDHVAEVFPAPWVVDRLTELYIDRRAAWELRLDGGRMDMRLLRSHGREVLRTAWHVVRVQIRAGRFDTAAMAIDGIQGVGDAPALRTSLESALGPGATEQHWIEVATHFIDQDPSKSDYDTALRVCVEGARRFPDSTQLLQLAAAIARDGDDYWAALAYLERAHAVDPSDRDAADDLAQMYEWRMSFYASTDRPDAAAQYLSELETFHADAAKRWPNAPLEHGLADAYATMGRGMLSQGDVKAAVGYFDQSLDERESFGALEQLGTLHLKRGDPTRALEYYDRALAMTDADTAARFARGRVRRLAGQARAELGDRERAMREWEAALAGWKTVAMSSSLTARGRAEVFIETGRLMWALDAREPARRAFELAIDADPTTSSTYADIVSFLIVRDQYADALDAYHRAIGAREVDDYFKVYTSLWILAEGRRTGRPDDPNAIEYLSSRDGDLWHDHLARYAIGKTSYADMYARANTRGRRAELYFYAATLEHAQTNPAEATRLLRDVLATDMLLFFEYDMARYILNRDAAPSVRAASSRTD